MKREHRFAGQNGQCRRLETCLEVRLTEETHRVVVQVRRDCQAVHVAPQCGKCLEAVLGHLCRLEAVRHAVHLPRENSTRHAESALKTTDRMTRGAVMLQMAGQCIAHGRMVGSIPR